MNPIVRLSRMLALALWVVTAHAGLAQADGIENAESVAEGIVIDLSYRPQVRNGRTLLSFMMAVEGREVRVITPFAGLVSVGDRVRVSGKLNGTEMDATDGDLEVVAKVERPKAIPAPGTSGRGVPTEIIGTPWSQAVDVASFLSCIFALIASIPLVLHLRRFNVDLSGSAPKGIRVGVDANGDLRADAELRMLSTGSLVPYIRDDIHLHIGGARVKADRTNPVGENASFPLAVDREAVVELSFALPARAGPLRRPWAFIEMRDAYSRARFKVRLDVKVQKEPAKPSREPLGQLHTADSVGISEQGNNSITAPSDVGIELPAAEAAGVGTNKDG